MNDMLTPVNMKWQKQQFIDDNTWKTGFLSELTIPKFKMRSYVGEIDPREIMRDIQNQAIDNIVAALRDVEPDAPDEVLRAFVITFIGLEVDFEERYFTKERKVIAIPFWKDTSMIDWDSKEAKLLDEYCWSKCD